MPLKALTVNFSPCENETCSVVTAPHGTEKVANICLLISKCSVATFPAESYTTTLYFPAESITVPLDRVLTDNVPSLYNSTRSPSEYVTVTESFVSLLETVIVGGVLSTVTNIIFSFPTTSLNVIL